MRNKTRSFSATLCAMILGFGGLALATPAQAAASVVSISDGQLTGKGTAVYGTYTVTCQAGESIFISLELRQRAGGKTITTATVTDSFSCVSDGTPVTRQYVFSNSSTTFKQGTATVAGSVLSIAANTSEAVLDEIKLLK